MSHQISQQHPAVVLRSHYVHMRALLAIAMIAVVGLTVTVVLLATRENSTASASSATPATSSLGTSGTSAGGGPIDPGYGYGGHPERGYRPESAAADEKAMPPSATSARPRIRAGWQSSRLRRAPPIEQPRGDSAAAALPPRCSASAERSRSPNGATAATPTPPPSRDAQPTI